LDEQTRVNRIRIRSGQERLRIETTHEEKQTSATLIELPSRPTGLRSFFQPDQLVRNLATVGCLALVVLALHSIRNDETQTVFSALRSEMDMKWDENVGRLSFVSDLLPAEIRAVWSEVPAVQVMAPITGETLHAWSEQEPYLELQGAVSDVRAAAAGEVMSIAHGLEEERIVRIRHADDSETLYGNLETCFVEVGDWVETGEIFAALIPGEPLAFELRVDGRSIDPQNQMVALTE